MNPKTEALKARTKRFALDILAFVDNFPERRSSARMGLRWTDAATSVAANDRAACRSHSDREFAAKIGEVLEEADESLLWLELADGRELGPRDEKATVARRSRSVDGNLSRVDDYSARPSLNSKL